MLKKAVLSNYLLYYLSFVIWLRYVCNFYFLILLILFLFFSSTPMQWQSKLCCNSLGCTFLYFLRRVVQMDLWPKYCVFSISFKLHDSFHLLLAFCIVFHLKLNFCSQPISWGLEEGVKQTREACFRLENSKVSGVSGVSVEQLWECRGFHCREMQNWLIAWDPQRAEVTSHYVPLKPALCSQHNQTGECCVFS